VKKMSFLLCKVHLNGERMERAEQWGRRSSSILIPQVRRGWRDRGNRRAGRRDM
jgi:hypothetical protein